MKKLFFILCMLPLLLNSCISSKQSSLTKETRYGKLYEEQPVSILIMPPINKTNNVAAKEYMYTTLYQPLCNLGYYVFPPYMTLDILQRESAYDSEMFIEGDLSKFREYIGADIVLFTVIHNWKKGMSSINTQIEYRLVSTHSNEVLYSHVGDLTLDFSSGNNSGLFGLLAEVISTATTPVVEVARNSNAYILRDMPRGKYSENYMKDKEWSAEPLNISATIKK